MAPRYALSMLLSPHSSKPVRLIQADIDHALIGWESFNRGPDTEGLAETLTQASKKMLTLVVEAPKIRGEVLPGTIGVRRHLP